MREWIQLLWPYVTAFVVLAVDLWAVGHAVLYKRDPRSAVGWIGIIVVFPFFGALLYLLLGINPIELGGAPFALDDPAWRPLRRKLLSALAQPGMTAILDAAGALDTAKLPLAAPVGWMQRWLHDLLGLRLAGLIRYYPDERAALAALAPRLNVARLPAFEQSLLHASRFGHHTLNVRMQLEQLLLQPAYQPGQGRQRRNQQHQQQQCLRHAHAINPG